MNRVASAPIVLVPGFWLGAWAWDEVAGLLLHDGHAVTALTLPGLESVEVDRSAVRLVDHVDAICAAIEAAGAPVVLVVHSGAGVAGYAASDRLPERIKRVVYVDSAPGTGALNPDFLDDELPFRTHAELRQENLEGLSKEQLQEFRHRAVPQPGATLRDAPVLVHAARLDVPSTVICTGFKAEQVQAAIGEGYPWLAGLAELHDVTYVDLPTSHWPMWSKPRELAVLLAAAAAD